MFYARGSFKAFPKVGGPVLAARQTAHHVCFHLCVADAGHPAMSRDGDRRQGEDERDAGAPFWVSHKGHPRRLIHN